VDDRGAYLRGRIKALSLFNIEAGLKQMDRAKDAERDICPIVNAVEGIVSWYEGYWGSSEMEGDEPGAEAYRRWRERCRQEGV
jgi:predicted alpha/beta hydrolase